MHVSSWFVDKCKDIAGYFYELWANGGRLGTHDS